MNEPTRWTRDLPYPRPWGRCLTRKEVAEGVDGLPREWNRRAGRGPREAIKHKIRRDNVFTGPRVVESDTHKASQTVAAVREAGPRVQAGAKIAVKDMRGDMCGGHARQQSNLAKNSVLRHTTSSGDSAQPHRIILTRHAKKACRKNASAAGERTGPQHTRFRLSIDKTRTGIVDHHTRGSPKDSH